MEKTATSPTSATVIKLPLPKKAKQLVQDKWSPQVMKLGFKSRRRAHFGRAATRCTAVPVTQLLGRRLT